MIMSTGQFTPGPDRRPETGVNAAPPRSVEPSADRAATNGSAQPYATGGQGPAATGTAPTPPSGAAERKVTRAGVIWAAVVAALVLLILLIIFILQNQELVLVKFLGFEGSVPLGMALFIAAVTGGVLVAAAGGARILQLRRNARGNRAPQRR